MILNDVPKRWVFDNTIQWGAIPLHATGNRNSVDIPREVGQISLDARAVLGGGGANTIGLTLTNKQLRFGIIL